MKESAKCFIKIQKGIYEQITYKELKQKRKKDITYKNKKFIQVDDNLIEVSNAEHKIMEAEEQRLKYINRIEKKLNILSYDKKNDNQTYLKDIIANSNYDIEFEVESKIEVEQLKKALLKLNKEEYRLIKALFYEGKTTREYAKSLGIPFTTIQSKKNNIIRKLKNILNN